MNKNSLKQMIIAEMIYADARELLAESHKKRSLFEMMDDDYLAELDDSKFVHSMKMMLEAGFGDADQANSDNSSSGDRRPIKPAGTDTLDDGLPDEPADDDSTIPDATTIDGDDGAVPGAGDNDGNVIDTGQSAFGTDTLDDEFPDDQDDDSTIPDATTIDGDDGAVPGAGDNDGNVIDTGQSAFGTDTLDDEFPDDQDDDSTIPDATTIDGDDGSIPDLDGNVIDTGQSAFGTDTLDDDAELSEPEEVVDIDPGDKDVGGNVITVDGSKYYDGLKYLNNISDEMPVVAAESRLSLIDLLYA